MCLAPKLVGESVGIHPVWLIFALLAFGYLFGFVGLLVAVPLAATIGVLARFALKQYLASPVYTGQRRTERWKQPLRSSSCSRWDTLKALPARISLRVRQMRRRLR